MPSFLKKIFRRSSKKSDVKEGSSKKLTKKNKKALMKQKKEEARVEALNGAGNDAGGGSVHLAPLSKSPNSVTCYKKDQVEPVKHTLVDLDDSSMYDTSDSHAHDENQDPLTTTATKYASPPPPLSHQRLQQHSKLYQSNDRVLQLTRLSNGQLTTIGPENQSERAESPTSTDFCLSTDIEDEAYNELRKKQLPLSPTSDDTEEYVLFPGIKESSVTPMANETADDLRAWTPCAAKKKKFHFEDLGDKVGEDVFPQDPFESNVSPPKITSTTAVNANNNFFVRDSESPCKKTELYPDSSDSEFESNSEKRPLAGENVLLTTDSGSDASKPKRKDEPITHNFSKNSDDQVHDKPSQKSPQSDPITPSSLNHHRPRTATSGPLHVSPLAPDVFKEKHSRRKHLKQDDDSSNSTDEQNWLFDEMKDALGPATNADLESLGGRSRTSQSHASRRSMRSHNSRRHRRQRSTDSGGSRTSHRSTRSQLSHMSDASRSVAKDLLRLEMQLAMVDKKASSSGSRPSSLASGHSRDFYDAASSVVSHGRHKTSRRNRITVQAPPGKLGIILANKSDVLRGTVVSGVRSSSVLAQKIFPGDRIVMIDGEDVSRMTVSEITTIMARKTEFERTLTVMTTPMSSSRSKDFDEGASTASGQSSLLK